MLLQRNFSNAMTVIKTARKLSITDFSEEIGISRSSMQEILKGTCNPRISTIEYIADNLGVHPAGLLFPGCSNSQLEFSLILLQTLETFSDLPEDRQREAAELLCQLLRIQYPINQKKESDTNISY